jgi:hypothetical protein
MRLMGSISLSLAAFGLVVARPDNAGPASAMKDRVEILSDTDYCS